MRSPGVILMKYRRIRPAAYAISLCSFSNWTSNIAFGSAWVTTASSTTASSFWTSPSVLRERVADYFEMDTDSPYMLLVAPVLEKRRTELTEEQERLWGIELLKVPRSDIPAVTHIDHSARIQTVHSDTMGTQIEMLAAGNCLLRKEDQDPFATAKLRIST